MIVKCKIGPVMLDRPQDMDGYEPDNNVAKIRLF